MGHIYGHYDRLKIQDFEHSFKSILHLCSPSSAA